LSLQDYSNERLFMQYGFTLEANPAGSLPWPPLSAPSSLGSTDVAATGIGTEAAEPSADVKAALIKLKNQVFEYLIEGASR
jgi:hypothetical protein